MGGPPVMDIGDFPRFQTILAGNSAVATPALGSAL